MGVEPATRPVFGISAVARMLGVPAATIRTWEDRYRLVVPERTASGHRLYSREQVGQLRFVRAQMSEGLGAADAHRLLAERLDGGSFAAGEPALADGDAGPAVPPQATILLAECDRYAAELQKDFLTTEGFEVDVALSEAEARSALSGRRPAVAVIEPLISGGAGLELCRSFKRSGVPVIVASVLQAREQALAAGADAFLGKPLNPPRLLSAIRDLLGQGSQARTEAAL